MKKYFLCILAALFILIPRVAYADYNCLCNGDFTYFDAYKNPFTWLAITHSVNDDGNLVDCQQSAFSRPALGDEFYMVRLSTPDYLYYERISISLNDEFEYFDADGSLFKITYEEQQNLGGRGFCNEKYYSTTGALAKLCCKWDESYVDSIDYTITSDDYLDAVNKLDALAQWLCGGRSDLPDGVVPEEIQPIYDLEPPLNVKVKAGSWDKKGIQSWTSILDVSFSTYDPFKIWWTQRNIDLSNFYTEIYVKENGMCRENKLIGAGPWKAFDSGFIFADSVITSDYCNNSLTPFEYLIVPLNEIKVKGLTSVPDDYVDIVHDYLRGKCPSGYKYEFKTCDFLLRNMQEVDGVTHYSNWVWVQMYEDGTYTVSELNNGYQPDVKDPNAPPDEEPGDPDNPSDPEEPTTTPNPDPDFVVPDSPNYPSGGNQFPSYDPGETNPPGLNGVNDVSTFLKVLTDLAKSLGSFPSLFAQIFQFLPIWVISIVGCLFVVILLRGIF